MDLFTINNIMKVKFKYTYPYKYKLTEDFVIEIGIMDITIDHPYIKLKDGVLTIKKGYAWNGSSGLSIDTKTNHIASLVHDAMYQLFRLELLPIEYRNMSDIIYRSLCLKAGMITIRAYWSYYALKWFGAYSAKPGREMYPRPEVVLEI